MSYEKSLRPLALLLSLSGCSSTTITPAASDTSGGASTLGGAAGSATAKGNGGANLGGLGSGGMSNAALGGLGSGGTSSSTLGGLGSGGSPTPSAGATSTLSSGGALAATGGTSVAVNQGGTVAIGSAGSTATSGGTVGSGGTTIVITPTGGKLGMAGSAGSACGFSTQSAELSPLYMVFLYDKSGSMGDAVQGNLASRWEPLKQGMIDFFNTAGTLGLEASLEFFPAPGDKVTTCHADYKTPAVPAMSLAAPQPLIDALNATLPGGGTPTLPAVMGGIAYAKQLMANDPGSKAVVVLVTDGEPAIFNVDTLQNEIDCAPAGSTLTNTIADITTVTNAAYRGSPSVATYVIGIGEAQSNMAAIATAGGTEYVQLDATQTPATTAANFTSALKSIRTTHFQCSMPVPSATGFQKELLNVSFTHTDGTVEELSQLTNCAKPGWYYDNATAPSKIVFCPVTCAAIQSDAKGSIQLQLGCPTRTN